MHAIALEGKAVGDGAHSLVARPLGGECRARAGPDHGPLVLRRSIDDGSKERVAWRVEASFARRAHEARACSRGDSLDLCRQDDVARDAIAPGDDQYDGTVSAKRREGRP